jgi:RNA polymerase sigma factor (sigma-70 family)
MTRLATIRLDLDELEALRLCDLDRLDQEEAARRMGVSRGTVQRLIKRGRAKVAEALVTSSALLIEEEGNHEDPDTV